MPKKTDRIIIDTNLWISFLLTHDFLKFDEIFSDKPTTLLFSQNLLNEFIEVAQRPKFKKYFTPDDFESMLFEIKCKSEVISITSTVSGCRNPKDNFLLALAKDGKATHLLTGDKDLLEIKVFGKTKILTISDYLKNIKV